MSLGLVLFQLSWFDVVREILLRLDPHVVLYMYVLLYMMYVVVSWAVVRTSLCGSPVLLYIVLYCSMIPTYQSGTQK